LVTMDNATYEVRDMVLSNASFGGVESIQRYFRRRCGIKVLRMVRCFVLDTTVTRETQAAVCLEQTWRMTKDILSRRLATDSARGTSTQTLQRLYGLSQPVLVLGDIQLVAALALGKMEDAAILEDRDDVDVRRHGGNNTVE
jgi:hypothetical protein